MFLSIEEYIDRRDEWQRHLDSRYLRVQLSPATAQETAEQVFIHQPRKHQAKYAAKHDEVEPDIEALKTYFYGYHTKDVNNGTFDAIDKSMKQQRGARKSKDEEGWTKMQAKKPSSSYCKSGGK